MIVNNKPISLASLESDKLQSLLDHFKLDKNHVAVEINGAILRKSDYGETRLNDDDKIELIHFVGGGA